MQKKEIRHLYRQKRAGLAEKERIRLDDLLLISFQTAQLPFITSLLSYAPIEENGEPNAHLFTDYLLFRNPELQVCYPVSDFAAGTMQAVLTHADTPFHKNEWNIHEPLNNEILAPAALDMVFVPLLAVDEKGYRVGYGKGFYDRYLAECLPDCIKVGFSYFDPVPVISDTDGFDVPLDLCITPQNVYVF